MNICPRDPALGRILRAETSPVQRIASILKDSVTTRKQSC